ncbi:MAG: endonuclease/exonuclease/phosphatase family protein [Ginsengibacter sp.]
MSYYKTPVFKKILIFINICFVIAYLSVCLVPFVNTGVHWYIAIPGIIFPILFFALLFFIILWIILKSRIVWVSVIALTFGFQQIPAVFAFHLPSDFTYEKLPNTLRVMQWNVMGWDQENEKSNLENGGHSLRPFMMDLIREQNADVLCFEEFYESEDTLQANSNISSITKMGYPYHFFVPVDDSQSVGRSGIIIFSKDLITGTARFDLNTNKRGEHLIYADIKKEDHVFRIFATHLIPIKFGQWDEQRSIREQLYGSESFDNYKSIFSKLIRGYSFRYHQSKMVGRKIFESPYPSVICGDFNDIPNSSTYFNVKGNLQDPFLKKGYWTGRTTKKSFGIISPTLRIDYILAHRSFKVNQFQILQVPFSDHYPVETDLQY